MTVGYQEETLVVAACLPFAVKTKVGLHVVPFPAKKVNYCAASSSFVCQWLLTKSEVSCIFDILR